MKTTFDFIPYSNIGPIRFGMTKNEILLLFPGENYEEFYRGDEDPAPTGVIDRLGIFICYDEAMTCEALEFTQSAEFIFEGVNLFEQTYANIKNIIGRYDAEFEEDESGFTSYKLGLGCFIIDETDQDLPPEGIIAFKRGYYDL